MRAVAVTALAADHSRRSPRPQSGSASDALARDPLAARIQRARNSRKRRRSEGPHVWGRADVRGVEGRDPVFTPSNYLPRAALSRSPGRSLDRARLAHSCVAGHI